MKVLPVDTSGYGFQLPDLPEPVIFGEAITHEVCLEALSAAMLSQTSKSGVFATTTKGYLTDVNQYHRSSSYCNVYDRIRRRVDESLVKLISASAGAPVKLAEPLQFLKYDSNNQGKFLPHTDSAYFDSSGKFQYTSPHRIFTSVTYLNSDFEGGHLVINSVIKNGAPLRVVPTPRLTVLFPSDVRFKHEVEPVTKGVRYSIVGWYKFS